MDDRVYMRIDGKLKQGAQAYCAARNTTLSKLVTRFLARLVSAEESRKKVKDAAQGADEEG